MYFPQLKKKMELPRKLFKLIYGPELYLERSGHVYFGKPLQVSWYVYTPVVCHAPF